MSGGLRGRGEADRPSAGRDENPESSEAGLVTASTSRAASLRSAHSTSFAQEPPPRFGALSLHPTHEDETSEQEEDIEDDDDPTDADDFAEAPTGHSPHPSQAPDQQSHPPNPGQKLWQDTLQVKPRMIHMVGGLT